MTTTRVVGLFLLIAGLSIGVLGRSATPTVATVSPIVAARGVAPDATSDNGQRKLARADDGTLYLGFTAPVEDVEQAQIYFSADDGQSWKPEVTLAQPGVWSDLATLSAGRNGRLDAAWVDYTTVGNVWHASLQDGTWSEFEKISPGTTYAGYPAMVVVGDTANVLWYSAPPDEDRAHGSAYEIEHSAQTEGMWSEPELLSSNSEDALNPALALAPDGTLYGAWFQNFQGSYAAQVAQLAGQGWSFPTLISTPATTATGVSIDIGLDGVGHLVWEQANDDVFGVAYSRLQDGEWTAPIALGTNVSQDPVVASDDSGRVVVVWSEDGALKARVWDDGWSTTSDLGTGVNPSTLSGEQVLATWTRDTSAGSEVVTSYIDLGGASSEPGAIVLITAITMMIVGIVLVLWRRDESAGSDAGDGED